MYLSLPGNLCNFCKISIVRDLCLIYLSKYFETFSIRNTETKKKTEKECRLDVKCRNVNL